VPFQPAPEDRQGLLAQELLEFTGDLDRWRHPLHRRLLYTPGVRYLAERAGSFWLVDAIASWLGSKEFVTAARRDPRISDIHFWRLAVADDKSAMLTAVADSGEQPFIEQAIEFTDFPLATINLWAAWDGRYWTLMVPSEY
jgi:hypothetical protein